MSTRTPRLLNTVPRLVITTALAIVLLPATSCNLVHKSVPVEKLLTPLSEGTTAELVAQVNQMATVRSLHGRIDIQFEDTSFASAGIAEKYRVADGSLTVQRPGKIYLIIQGPLAIDIAQMTSDGEHFRIAIIKGDEKYRRFVRGSNNAVYQKLETDDRDAANKGKRGAEAQTVQALSNLRPQHLTDALLITPIDLHAAGLLYAQSEFFQSEKDPSNPGSSKRVMRGYYFLDELRPDGNGSARLLRRFWFDRVNGIRLARLQNFNESGALITDVSYGPVAKFGEAGASLPAKIGLTRLQDRYQITITYQDPAGVTVDHDYPPEVFVLENKWKLTEIDLDTQKKPSSPND
jgi:hypothetical protein